MAWVGSVCWEEHLAHDVHTRFSQDKKVILLYVQMFHNFSYLSVILLKDKGELDISDQALIGQFLDIHVQFLLLCDMGLSINYVIHVGGGRG